MFIPRFKLYRKGIIHQIPLDISLDELQQVIEENNGGIRVNKLFKLKERDRETKKWIDSFTICLELRGETLPEKLIIWKVVTPVSVYIPAVRLCFRCGTMVPMGHISKTCTKREIYV